MTVRDLRPLVHYGQTASGPRFGLYSRPDHSKVYSIDRDGSIGEAPRVSGNFELFSGAPDGVVNVNSANPGEDVYPNIWTFLATNASACL